MVGSSSLKFLSLLPLAWAWKFLLLLPLLSATGCSIGCYCTFSALGAVRRCMHLAGEVGFNSWLAKISSPGQAWQKCLHSPVWPDSIDRLYSVVRMPTEQHSTSMQSLSQSLSLLNQCQVRGPAIVGSNPLPCKYRREKHKRSFSTDIFSHQSAFEL